MLECHIKAADYQPKLFEFVESLFLKDMTEKETNALKEAIFANMAQILGLDAKKGTAIRLSDLLDVVFYFSFFD